MPDGSSPALPVRPFAEVQAHLIIQDAVLDFRDCVIGRATLRLRIERRLDTFAPRCNCGRVLSRKAQVGLVLWSCSCGWFCREAR